MVDVSDTPFSVSRQRREQSDIVDADGDGFDMLSDCDDSNAMINPEALEACDGFDNDCDGLIDDEDDSVTQTREPLSLPISMAMVCWRH